MAVATLVLFFLVLYPLFWLFYGSFAYGDQVSSGAVFSQFWQLPGLARAFQNTLELLLGAVPLSFLLALPLVWIVARTDTPLKGLIEIAALLPFITPPLIGAVAWALLAAPRTGLINVLARQLGAAAPVLNIYSMSGLIFVMSLYVSPYVFLTVQAVMQRMDASLEEASVISGASLSRNIFNVVLPLSMPAILSAAILVITRILEEFAIPGVLGAPSGIYTITTYIYYQAISYVPPRYEVAALLASLLMGLTAILLVLQSRILGGSRRFTTVSGKGQPPRLLRLGPWRYAHARLCAGLHRPDGGAALSGAALRGLHLAMGRAAGSRQPHPGEFHIDLRSGAQRPRRSRQQPHPRRVGGDLRDPAHADHQLYDQHRKCLDATISSISSAPFRSPCRAR